MAVHGWLVVPRLSQVSTPPCRSLISFKCGPDNESQQAFVVGTSAANAALTCSGTAASPSRSPRSD
jgi:hypothetical protein